MPPLLVVLDFGVEIGLSFFISFSCLFVGSFHVNIPLMYEWSRCFAPPTPIP